MDTVLKQQEMLCAEKHKNIDDKLEAHGQRFDNHEQRIDFLEKAQVRSEISVRNVCSQVKALTTVLWWTFGLMFTTAVGFVIWYIQSIPR